MAGKRQRRRSGQSNYTNLRNRNNRDYVALVSKNKLVGIWTGDEETSRFQPAENDRDTRLTALKMFDEILEQIPTNDELLDKQVAIYALDCVEQCFTKPGDVIRSKEVSDEAKEMIPELAAKFAERNYNCFLVSEKGSNATIVNDGFAWLQETSERIMAGALGVTYEKPSDKSNKATASDPVVEKSAKLAKLLDQLEDCVDEEEEAKLEKQIAKVESSRI